MLRFFFGTPLRLTISAIVVAIGLGIAWVLVSPLFIDNVVDEQLPEVTAPADTSAATATPTGPVQLAGGSFTGADDFHRGQGSATALMLADGSRIIRFEDFEVTNGPDLRIWLTNADTVSTSADVKAAQSIDLGKLKGNVGAQNYSVPEGTDLSDFKHVVVWCRAFGVLFAGATLQ